MTTRKIIGTALICTLVLFGCNKGGSMGPEGMDPVQELINTTREQREQHFTVNATTGGQVIGTQGTRIIIPPNAFRRHNGSTVTGLVSISLLEAYSVADMVALNMQTKARNGNGRMALLSGGEVRLRAEANGEKVTPAAGQIMLMFPGDQLDPGMRAWIGEEDADGQLLWDGENDLVLVVDTNVADTGFWQNPGYYGEPWPANAFGDPNWPDYDFINCDRPLPPGGDSTDITINFPQGENARPQSTWLVFPDINCMVYMEAYEPSGIRAGFPVRVGLQGTIVALRIDENGQYYSSFTPITVVDGHQQDILMQATTQAQYLQDIGAL